MRYVLGHRRTDRPLWRRLPRMARFALKLAFAQERLLFQPKVGDDGRWIASLGDDARAVVLPGEIAGVGFAATPDDDGRQDVAVLFIPGAIGNLAGEQATLSYLRRLGVATLAYDHPGFGRSGGRASLSACRRAARDAWALLVRETPSRRVVLFGRSFGGTIAAELARDLGRGAGSEADGSRLAGLVVLDAFSSAADMVKRLLPGWLVALGNRVHLDTAAAVRGVSMPTLVVHAEHDEVVPCAQGRRVYEAAAGPRRWVAVAGGHFDGEWRHDPRVRDAWEDLLRERAGAWPAATP